MAAGCLALAPNIYLDRHNRAKIYLAVCNTHTNAQDDTPYYKYASPSIYEDYEYKLCCNRTIVADRTIPNNNQFGFSINEEERTANLIDVAVPLP